MTITVEELRRIVREEVRRVLLEAFLELVPVVDEKEQREIERIAGKPSDYREEEFMDWGGE
ncbi:MAG: hypothetical protein B6U76_10705 [Desulfurococcales archaeon ex4484_217_2]|nr:MAG: hypothetical protein B6U76_10705 [Desulfurococcales archaeon ex4484_217_2]